MKASRLLALSSTLFLLGASALFAESRIRLNTAISTSSEDPSLGAQTLKYKSSGSTLATGAAEDKKDSQAVGGATVHYVTEGGWMVGVHRHTNEFKTVASQTGAWTATATLDALDAITPGTKTTTLATLGSISTTGTILGTRESSGYVNFLDLGYMFGGDFLSLGVGIGLPVLGSASETKIVYTTAGYALNGNQLAETIESKGKSASSYFLDFGMTFGSVELTLGYRNIETKSEAEVDTTKGLGKILDKSTFESEGKHTLTTVGLGFLF